MTEELMHVTFTVLDVAYQKAVLDVLWDWKRKGWIAIDEIEWEGEVGGNGEEVG